MAGLVPRVREVDASDVRDAREACAADACPLLPESFVEVADLTLGEADRNDLLDLYASFASMDAYGETYGSRRFARRLGKMKTDLTRLSQLHAGASLGRMTEYATWITRKQARKAVRKCRKEVHVHLEKLREYREKEEAVDEEAIGVRE